MGKEHDTIDHSMFRHEGGQWHTPDSIAELILHETAHTYHGEGTVGYWNTLLYYLEVIFLFRTVHHSDERIPRAVSEEFTYSYLMADATARGDHASAEAYRMIFDKHLAEEHEHCSHLDL